MKTQFLYETETLLQLSILKKSLSASVFQCLKNKDKISSCIYPSSFHIIWNTTKTIQVLKSQKLKGQEEPGI